jgi:hypothetical protein
MFDEPPPFWIILYYPNKHILAAYEYTTEQEGQYLQAVITPTGPDLCLWNANRIFKEPVACVNWAINADAGESKVISLEEATNMSIDSFYETYVEPTGEKKIETLATLWEQ